MSLRFITIVLLFTSINTFSFQNKKPCNKAYQHLDDAILSFEKAYRTDHSKDLRNFTNKAKNSLLKAMNAAKECGCTDALSAALDGAIETKKVMKANNFEDALYYVSMSRNYTEEALEYMSDCLLEYEVLFEGKVLDSLPLPKEPHSIIAIDSLGWAK
ncbi:hypothetical protein NWE55_13845 [Myroides albus]|uniref:Uncharacterized protein n=1 Tax=Myroides albus TaxID=2562892 RepID=A0A6I3LK17_9FLAO|nr:hypothetical protein [Myroides albus]MTG98633.1 hypothetical protein [Myroides albus]UVD79196.1 hypothetical protein NWE55_13845 [Myroides albus]